MTSPTRVEGYFWGLVRKLRPLTREQREWERKRQEEERMMLRNYYGATHKPGGTHEG